MLANAVNLRRAGLFLRAVSGSAGWSAGVFVDARSAAKANAIVATDKELAEIEGYLVDQGWLVGDGAESHGESRYALTRHGLHESFQKMPAEPKPYVSNDRAG